MKIHRPWSREEVNALVQCIEAQPSIGYAAQMYLGLYPDTVRKVHGVRQKAADLVKELGLVYGCKPESTLKSRSPFSIQRPPAVSRSIEQLIKDRAEEFGRKAAHHQAKHDGINITIHEPGPYMLVFFGDPHVDDAGCDIDHLAFCLEEVRGKEHVYAANIGDLTNNWVGKLARLYAYQTTTDDEAEQLMEWLIGSIPWLFIILGNHDKWGPIAGRICREYDVLAVSHGAKFNILQEGSPKRVIDARHTHAGNSMYNKSHAQLVLNYKGSPADIIIGGHLHVNAETVAKNGTTQQTAYCCRVSAFKKYDEYADANNFEDQAISPVLAFVIDPAHPGIFGIHRFFTIEQGYCYLMDLRRRNGYEVLESAQHAEA
ncbi:MAG: metallophosphatase family protein [Betaproteobacteria bacterium]|nr:metallophosphatase family protein [Betaproteobacteria bacterium]